MKFKSERGLLDKRRTVPEKLFFAMEFIVLFVI